MAYIEKNLWSATNFAAKMIRETGYRNKSIRTAANYYNVSEKEVEEQLIIRQKKGQKGMGKGEKFNYYVFYGEVQTFYGDDYGEETNFVMRRAKTSENARHGCRKESFLGGKGNKIEGSYIAKEDWDKNVKVFQNKKDAEAYLAEVEKDFVLKQEKIEKEQERRSREK
jgi:hypothetical protein